MMKRFQEIARELRHDIAVRTYPTGTALPAETQLAERFEASVPTVREALGLLQNDGLIEKRPGKGNFVLRPFERLSYTYDESFAGRSMAQTTLIVTVTSKHTSADTELSALLRVPVGTALGMYAFLSHQGESPHSLARVYVPRCVAELSPPETAWSPVGHDIRSQLSALGIPPASTTERLRARLPEPSEERLLRIGPSTAVLAVERRSMDRNGRVIEAATIVLPGHRSEALFSTHAPVAEMEEAR